MAALSFVHVPKTGGTSLSAALRVQVMHRRASECDGWKFAFVRDPAERFLSAWHFAKSTPLRKHGDVDRWPSADVFLLDQRERVFGFLHFMPMSHWLDAPVDFIGRYETLQADYVRLCDAIGIEGQKLPHERRHEGEREVLGSEALTVLRDVYAEDYARFYP